MPQPQLHAWSCKSLTAYNFCYEYAKDFYFQVDQKYEIINENNTQYMAKFVWPLRWKFWKN